MTYPREAHPYRRANIIMREQATAAGTPLIDLAPAFRAACPDEACEDLFFFDDHPTAKGHRLAAERIRAWLEDHTG